MSPAERIADLEAYLAELKRRLGTLPATGSDNAQIVAKLTVAAATAHRDLDAIYRAHGLDPKDPLKTSKELQAIRDALKAS